jgi:hypothetical protein
LKRTLKLIRLGLESIEDCKSGIPKCGEIALNEMLYQLYEWGWHKIVLGQFRRTNPEKL